MGKGKELGEGGGVGLGVGVGGLGGWGNKLFACFVDFKKAFDSVWHAGLYKKLEALRLHSNLLCLIKHIYKKTKCAVKSENKITQFLNFTEGVHQGCPTSP